jgi:hypothetical protein
VARPGVLAVGDQDHPPRPGLRGALHGGVALEAGGLAALLPAGRMDDAGHAVLQRPLRGPRLHAAPVAGAPGRKVCPFFQNGPPTRPRTLRCRRLTETHPTMVVTRAVIQAGGLTLVINRPRAPGLPVAYWR